MKRVYSILLIISFLLLCNPLLAQKTNKYMLGMLNYKAYCTEQMVPYIEFQFLIDGRTTQYVPTESGRFVSEVEVWVDIKQKDDNNLEKTVHTLHYILVSPEVYDTTHFDYPYFSDVQSVPVPNKDCFLEFKLKDIHGTTDTIKYIDYLPVDYSADKVSMSAISLWEKMNASGEGGIFEKYGFAVTPLFQQYAPETVYALPFTFEIYNTDKVLGNQKEFIVKTELSEVGFPADKNYTVYKKLNTAPCSIFFHQYDIYRLPSGNYLLTVSIMDLDSNVLTSNAAYFQRSNPSIRLDVSRYQNVEVASTFVEKMTDRHQLEEDVASLYPIATRMEQEFFNQRMKKVSDIELQRFFYSFWLKRDAANPERAWNEYQKKLEYVQQMYGSVLLAGFRTDRGRVYLKYGPPTNVTEEPYDPQAYPYEIWHYYELGDQTNVKFIFYNRDLATNNYILLHSDYIGEVQDPAWQMKLVKRLSPNSNPDVTVPEDYWGGNAREQYRYNK